MSIKIFSNVNLVDGGLKNRHDFVQKVDQHNKMDVISKILGEN